MRFADYAAAALRLENGGWRWSSSFGYPGCDNYSEFWRKGPWRASITVPERFGKATVTWGRAR